MNVAANKQVRRAMAATGWRDLLPAAARTRVLCVDIGDGHATLALAQTFEQVVAVPLCASDTATVSAFVRAAGATNVTVRSTLDQAFEEAPFEGVVSVLFGNVPEVPTMRGVRALIREAAAGVGDGFVLLAAPNALAYNRRPGRDESRLRTWGARGLARMAEGAAGRVRRWPVLLHDGVPFEILHGGSLPDAGRGWVTVPAGHRLLAAGNSWLAPGYIVLRQRENTGVEIEELLRDVSEVCGAGVRLERHLTTPDKTILVTAPAADSSRGRAGSEDRGCIVVLPRTRRALRRREREAELLRRTCELPVGLRERLPRFLGRGARGRQQWLAIERMPGVFVDEPVPDLDLLTERAADLLVQLHVETRRDVQVDESAYESMVGVLLESARRRHLGSARLLAQIDVQLRALLLGRTVPSVWMHGDYKLENVGVDAASRQPVSIIDWELASSSGLPLLDLDYLLVYNRMMRGRTTFEDVWRAEGTVWSPQESRLLACYIERLGLDAELCRVLRVLFVIHAVGARLQYDMSDPKENANLMRMLAAGRDQLALLLPARAGGVA